MLPLELQHIPVHMLFESKTENWVHPCHWTELLSAKIYSENIIFYRPPTRQHHPMEWRPLERDTMTAHRHVCGGGVVTCRTLMVIIILIGRMGHWFHHNLCGGVFGGWKSIFGGFHICTSIIEQIIRKSCSASPHHVACVLVGSSQCLQFVLI